MLNLVGAWVAWDCSENQASHLAPLKVGLGFVATSVLLASAAMYHSNRQQERALHSRPEDSVFFKTMSKNRFTAMSTTAACLSTIALMLVLAIYAEKNKDADNNVKWTTDHVKAVAITGTLCVTSFLSAVASFAIDYTTQWVAPVGAASECGDDDNDDAYRLMETPPQV